MRHPLSLLSAFLLLFIAVSIEAFVVPWSRSDSAQFSAPQRHESAGQQRPYRTRNVLPNLTWLRDFAIEKVFRVPKPVKAGSVRPGSFPHPSSSESPNTLLAKYGGDVVLRFNLSTPAEEKALAEAADTLFLDVWEFTQNWADIRLREDDVRRVVPESSDPLLTRSLGPLTSRVTAEILTEGIFEFNAGPG
jgi:extracellular matrix protein 14